MVTEAFGDTLRPDSTIDTEKLRESWLPMTLDEFYPEGNEHDAPMILTRYRS